MANKIRPWIARSTFAALAAAIGSAAMAGTPAMQATSATPTTTDRIIVKYRDGSSTQVQAAASNSLALQRQSALDSSAARFNVRMTHLRGTALGANVLRLDHHMTNADAAALARDIAAADPEVEYAEPDRILRPMFTPNDTYYASQWHYYESTAGLNLPAAWDLSTGTGITVAVIDTGYRPHADLAANIVSGYDFITDTTVSNDGNGRDADPSDPGDAIVAGECGSGYPAQDQSSSWHGTHVAGTIAAVTNNGTGVAGVAFGAKVQPVRVLGKCGGYTSDIADAIIWASGGTVSGVPANATPARVLNLSLGGSGSCDTTTQNAITSARSRNAVVVVAAGNSGANAANYSPASCTGIVTVAAVNRSGGRAYYSNYGSVVEVAAPGGDMTSASANGILSTLNAGATTPGADAYAYYQGTSMATPHVAGVVALMLAKNASLTPDQVITMLQSTARAFPATCSQCGTGIVDAAAAVNAAIAGSGGGTGSTTVAEVESNNTRSTAQTISTAGTTVNGSFSSKTDTDYYKVVLAAGKKLTATLTPNTSSDYDLYLYNSSGTQLARSVNGTGTVDTVTYTNSGSSGATLYVRAYYYSGSTGTAGTYTLKLSW
jgi:serine protease